MAKRSPQQVLDAIDAWDEDDAIDAEMKRVLARTPEERENDLRAAGVDVEAERVKAREWREKAAGGDLPAEETQRAASAASPQTAHRTSRAFRAQSRPQAGDPAGDGYNQKSARESGHRECP